MRIIEPATGQRGPDALPQYFQRLGAHRVAVLDVCVRGVAGSAALLHSSDWQHTPHNRRRVARFVRGYIQVTATTTTTHLLWPCSTIIASIVRYGSLPPPSSSLVLYGCFRSCRWSPTQTQLQPHSTIPPPPPPPNGWCPFRCLTTLRGENMDAKSSSSRSRFSLSRCVLRVCGSCAQHYCQLLLFTHESLGFFRFEVGRFPNFATTSAVRTNRILCWGWFVCWYVFC